MSPPQEGFALGVGDTTMMATNAVSGHEYLFQLQQQLQHQQMAQQGMAVAAAAAAAYGYSNGGVHHQSMSTPFPTPYMAPPIMPRVPSSAPLMLAPMVDDASTRSYGAVQPQLPSGIPTVDAPHGTGDEDAANVMQRLEKKDQMISQLGSFLSQMKQESEGTAATWKEKLHEIAELKRQLASTTQQLECVQESERNTVAELGRVRQELEAALAAQQGREQTHIDELTIMNDEIKKRQSEAEHMKVGYEQSLKDVAHELLQTQQTQQDAESRCHVLEAALREMEEGHHVALAQFDAERAEVKNAMASQLEIVDREKHELGQHLWHVTQELQLCKQREEELERRCAAAANDAEKTQSAWSERFHHFQSEKAEQLGVHSMLQTQLQELDTKFQSERSQKEELNAMMGREIERFRDELERLQQDHSAALTQAAEENERWRLRAVELQEKLAHAERGLEQANAELEEMHTRLESVDQENQHLQQNGTEKASTLQELNNQLGSVLSELQDVQSRYDHLQARWERHQSGLLKCLQLLPQTGGSLAASKELESSLNGDAFPPRIASVLEEYAQLSSTAHELKITVLRAHQELDSDRERFRLREQELLVQCQELHSELETARTDAKTLAQELQQLSRQSGGTESKLAAQVQQLTKELEEARTTGGLQTLQLQKSLESQRTRTCQLENEKKDLLQEAEHLNASMESLYQARNEKQAELDQLRATWKELQLEHSDLKENYEDLDERTARTLSELNAKLAELQDQIHTHRTESSALNVERSKLLDQLSRVQADYEAISNRYMSDQARWLEKEHELGSVLEDKTRRMDEMLEMLTQLQAKAEFLEKTRASDDQSMRQEIDKYQQQLLTLGQDKKRFEVAYSSLKAQHDHAMQDAFALKEEKRLLAQQHSEVEEELGSLQSELARLKGELERASRAKSSLQAELHRVTNEAQDVVRQFEVVRRDARAQEKRFEDEAERLRRESDELRAESSDANALVEDMQVKMTSIQNAANATINDLVAELQSAQEAIAYERARQQKESEQLKAQLQALDSDLRRKEADAKELHAALRQEKDQLADRENELALKLSRVSTALEQKRQEADKLSKELDNKALKVAEYERKLTPLTNAKESLQAKNAELKQSLDAKTREAHDLEERARDDLARVAREKREVEALYMTMKEDYDAIRSQTSGQQQQWQSDGKALKQQLERAKSELVRANTEVLALTQRLESCQSAANETISELAARLEAAEQQKEMAVNGLQREVNLERERRREAEVQKMELQRLVRQQQKGGGSASAPPPSAASAWSGGGGGGGDSDVSSSAAAKGALQSSAATTTPKAKAPPPPEIRKFYANEPLTNAELSNLPMALITAQIGLDLASASAAHKSDGSPTKTASRVRASSSSSLSVHERDDRLDDQQENNDDIPLLALEKLPQCVPASYKLDGRRSCSLTCLVPLLFAGTRRRTRRARARPAATPAAGARRTTSSQRSAPGAPSGSSWTRQTAGAASARPRAAGTTARSSRCPPAARRSGCRAAPRRPSRRSRARRPRRRLRLVLARRSACSSRRARPSSCLASRKLQTLSTTELLLSS